MVQRNAWSSLKIIIHQHVRYGTWSGLVAISAQAEGCKSPWPAKPSKAREGEEPSSPDLALGNWLCPANMDCVTCMPKEGKAGPSLVLA